VKNASVNYSESAASTKMHIQSLFLINSQESQSVANCICDTCLYCLVSVTGCIVEGEEEGRYSSSWEPRPSQSYGTSLAIWDHTALPATRHKWTRPA